MARPSRALPASAVRLLVAARSALTRGSRGLGPRRAVRRRPPRGAARRRGRPGRPDPTVRPPIRRPTSAWALLTGVAPELAEWAAYFAAGAAKRAAAEAGIRSAVTAREADDLLRDTTIFLQLVETTSACCPAPSRGRLTPSRCGA